MTITDKRLTEIQARTEVATEGPWGVDGHAQCGPEDSLSVYPVKGGGALAYMQPLWDDAQFIAHAREDIPALLAEVHRLKRRVGSLQSENHKLSEALTTSRHREAVLLGDALAALLGGEQS